MNRQQRRAAAKRSPIAGPARPRTADAGSRHDQRGWLDQAAARTPEAPRVPPGDADTLRLLGIARYRQGSFLEAVELLTRAIAVKPKDPEAYNNLGVALALASRLNEAMDAFRRAISISPVHVDAHNNLGNVLHTLGRPAEAEASYRAALRLRPDSFDAHNNLGNVLHALGRPAEAEASYRAALRLRPDSFDAHNNLGKLLGTLGRLAEAEASYRAALRLRPNVPDAHNNLGSALWGLGRLAEAEASYREALRLRPNYSEAHNNLGGALWGLGRLAEAEASYRAALRLRPDLHDAHNGLGNTLRDLGRPAEAEASHRDALRLLPNAPAAHNNLGLALCALGRTEEAVACYREALRLTPDLAASHANLAYALLLAGQFEEGWEEYEWRWKTEHMSSGARRFPASLWNGEAIGDRVILLHAEQGFGDTLQFCRYVPLIAAGARIVLEVQAPLVRLLARLPGVAEIVARGDRLPAFDLHCPLMSLPRAFGTRLDTIPAGTSYLAADPMSAARWRERLAGLDHPRVGLVWAGSSSWGHRAATDRRRSMSLGHFAELARVPGVSFVSLQKGEPARQAAAPPPGMALHDFTTDLDDFADTAGLVANLDLVISVDTAVGHLAGALGKPVWLLNRFDTCWRWLLHRDDSPWYPPLRQFRQPRPGDWNSAIGEVREALRRLAAGDRDQLRPHQVMR